METQSSGITMQDSDPVQRNKTHFERGVSFLEYEVSDEYKSLRDRLIAATGMVFGVNARSFQLRVALALHGGYDALCVAATGAGKTLSYIMPFLLNPTGIIVVISPLKSIMADHVGSGIVYITSVG